MTVQAPPRTCSREPVRFREVLALGADRATQPRATRHPDLLLSGLSGLPEAITTAFPHTVVQTCVVHVIRNAMKFVSYSDRKKVAAGMRTVYTAPTLEAAELAFAGFEAEFGEQYPGAIDVWRRAWNDFVPFLDYPPELRRIVRVIQVD